jgi:pyruvate dehydrogenase E2 component (dihydrolipoamide acetyltransferase)
MAEFRMPILGADMQAGTLVAWHRQPGDRVARGDVVAEVETEKGLIEVQIFVTGVIERLVVQPGQTVPVGTVLAVVREEGAPLAAPAPAALPAPAARAPGLAPGFETGPAPGRARVSPLARRRAAELGVALDRLAGSGPDGAITREDVERAAAGRPPAPPVPAPAGARPGPSTAVPGPPPGVPASAGPAGAGPVSPVAATAERLAQLRQTIGAAMARSKREVPHYYLATTVDLGPATAWLQEENARRPVTERLLPGVLFVRAVALALREVPELNAVWAGGEARRSDAVHVGVAVSLRQGGLVAPALHDADRRPLGELMRALRELVTRARAGRLRSSELADATITVTSLGDQGVETVFGIVYPPQVAIVGFGRIVERPWVVGGQVMPRPVVTATLSADHRVSDGHRGGLFLAAVDRLLQEPGRL